MLQNRIAIVAFLSTLLCVFETSHAQEEYTCIQAGKLFDGKSNSLRENVTILIKGKTIVEVGEKITIPSEARIIDLSGMTVMPGLIDTHTHIVLHSGDYDRQILRETPEYRAIYGVVNAKATLAAGVTTIRDLGNEGTGLADIALRDAINKGLVPGPRILTAIQPISATGAYDLVGYTPYYKFPPLSYEADGPVEIRKQVRHLIKLGADVFKIYIESYEKKEVSKDSLTGAFNYSPEELRLARIRLNCPAPTRRSWS